VYFKTDRAVIEARSFALLDNVAAVLRAHATLRIQVEGHTDSQGNDAYNKGLSQRRTEAVVAYLIRKGIAADRLIAMGFGEETPIADNRTRVGRAQNRRQSTRAAHPFGAAQRLSGAAKALHACPRKPRRRHRSRPRSTSSAGSPRCGHACIATARA
jgi:hypothetical protein